MVMRNRIDGSDAARWWDDLPPNIQQRIAKPPAPVAHGIHPADEPPEPLRRGELVRDLSRFAAMLALVAVGIMLYLLLAVMFVTG